jgi:hypothetical protein
VGAGRVHRGARLEGWVAKVKWIRRLPSDKQKVDFELQLNVGAPFEDPGAAARLADAALLVMEGPRKGNVLNFPLASYSEGEMQAAHQALLAWVGTAEFKGAYNKYEAELLAQFEANIKAVDRKVGATINSLAPHLCHAEYACRQAPQQAPLALAAPVIVHLPPAAHLPLSHMLKPFIDAVLSRQLS